MRVALDTNILVYAFVGDDDDERHPSAINIMIRAALADVILPAQVLGEFNNVIRRKFPRFAIDAAAQIAGWSETFPVIPTTAVEVERGAKLAQRHDLGNWDAIIWQVARSGGADYLLSEDMQDGLSIGGLTVVNPFNPANAALIDALLTPTEEIERP